MAKTSKYTPTNRGKALLRHIEAMGGFVTKKSAYDLLRQTREPNSPPLVNDHSLFIIVSKLEKAKYVQVIRGVDGWFVLLGIEGARYIAGKQDRKLTGADKYIWVKRVPHNINHELALQTIYTRLLDLIKITKGLRYTKHMFERELQRYKAPVVHRRVDGKEYTRQPVLDLYIEAELRGKKTLRIPLEYDSGSRQDPRLSNEKLFPFMEYLHSSAYTQFGGKPSYLWWITGRGNRRIKSLKGKLEEYGTIFKKRGFDEDRNMAENFLIVSLDDFNTHNIFTDAIFHRPFTPDPVSIFELI